MLTNNEAVGRYGPSKLKYQGVLKHEVKVSPKHPGIQLWTVPTSGIWSIEARGASGADGILAGGYGNSKRGGYGAIVKAKFQLHAGKVLKILIGHEGSRDVMDPHRPGGGGGGTFVVYQDGRPLIVAGGGGGGGIPRASEYLRYAPPPGVGIRSVIVTVYSILFQSCCSLSAELQGTGLDNTSKIYLCNLY